MRIQTVAFVVLRVDIDSIFFVRTIFYVFFSLFFLFDIDSNYFILFILFTRTFDILLLHLPRVNIFACEVFVVLDFWIARKFWYLSLLREAFYLDSFIFTDPQILEFFSSYSLVNIFICRSTHPFWYPRLSLRFFDFHPTKYIDSQHLRIFESSKLQVHRSSDPWILNFWILESITFESSYQYRKQKGNEITYSVAPLQKALCAFEKA